MTAPLHPSLGMSADAASSMFDRDPVSGQRLPDPAAEGVEAALTFGAEQAAALAALDTALRQDPTIAGPARALRLRQAAEMIGGRVAERVDRARARLVNEIERVARATAAPAFDPALAALEPELRAALRALPAPTRDKAIADAQATSDFAVLGAILRAPPLASGLDGHRLGIIRDQYRRQYHPEDAARLARLENGLQGLDRAIGAFAHFVGQAAASDEARRAEVAASRTATATAALSDEGCR